jgi:hypothetical protein
MFVAPARRPISRFCFRPIFEPPRRTRLRLALIAWTLLTKHARNTASSSSESEEEQSSDNHGTLLERFEPELDARELLGEERQPGLGVNDMMLLDNNALPRSLANRKLMLRTSPQTNHGYAK